MAYNYHGEESWVGCKSMWATLCSFVVFKEPWHTKVSFHFGNFCLAGVSGVDWGLREKVLATLVKPL